MPGVSSSSVWPALSDDFVGALLFIREYLAYGGAIELIVAHGYFPKAGPVLLDGLSR